MLKLYNYFRSSASYRVRIALHWKELEFEYVPVHLVKDGGHQNRAEYRRLNPMGHVPTLDHDGEILTESMAILQYLDDVYTHNRLFPARALEKARVVQLCETVNSGIQPLQNLKLMRYLEHEQKLPKPESEAFVKHWIGQGLESLEKLLALHAGQHVVGDQFTAADCFVIPQCATSLRFGFKMEDYPLLNGVYKNGLELSAVKKAQPDQQPDAQT